MADPANRVLIPVFYCFPTPAATILAEEFILHAPSPQVKEKVSLTVADMKIMLMWCMSCDISFSRYRRKMRVDDMLSHTRDIKPDLASEIKRFA